MNGIPRLIWALIDNRPGNATQALGVAEAVAAVSGASIVEKVLDYGPLARLPNLLRGGTLVGITTNSAATLGPPWPDVVVAAGRRAAPVSRWIKRQSHGRARIVQIMNPGRAGAARFDMIAVPHHDCPMPGGDPTNWFRVTGAPHRLTPERLTEAAAAWRSRFSGVTRPMVALLVGGATRQHPFPDDMAADLGRRVAGAARQRNGSVVLATSRRTGPSATRMLLQAIGHGPHVLWGDPSANSYVGLLALADAIVVTGDSVSMCSEACANDKPVYIAAQAELTAPKHRRLHDDLYRRGLARPFADVFDEWSHAPLNAAQDVARRILELM